MQSRHIVLLHGLDFLDVGYSAIRVVVVLELLKTIKFISTLLADGRSI